MTLEPTKDEERRHVAAPQATCAALGVEARGMSFT